MAVKIKLKNCTGEQFARRAFFLLYQACGRESGMGFFQARHAATEDDVFQNVGVAGDYAGAKDRKPEKGRAYADYVFGRMIKWGCKWSTDTFETHDKKFDPEYQGFAHKLCDDQAIITAVAESLGAEYEQVNEKT